jgi:hypothetical protein
VPLTGAPARAARGAVTAHRPDQLADPAHEEAKRMLQTHSPTAEAYLDLRRRVD